MHNDGPCEGCGKSGKGQTEKYELAPGVRVELCWMYRSDIRSTMPAKGSCREKALRKLQLCPGCGAKGIALGALCYPCQRRLIAGQNVEAAEKRAKDTVEASMAERKLTKYLVAADAVIPSRLWFELKTVPGVTEVGDLLARAFGEHTKGGDWRPGQGIPTIPRGPQSFSESLGARVPHLRGVLLADDQVEALTQLYEAVERLVAKSYAHGVEHGGKTMLRLAAGEITADAYDADTSRARQLAKEVVDDVDTSQARRHERRSK